MTTTAGTPTVAPPDPLARGDATEKALDQIQRSISNDHPWAPREHVGEELRSRYERTRDAKVQNYRLLLAERETRAQLRRERSS